MYTTWNGAAGTPGFTNRTRVGELLTEANVFLLRPDASGEFVLFRDVYHANGRDITFPDGKKLFVGSSGTGAMTSTSVGCTTSRAVTS